ncbi:MAG: LemA family protein, partial [Gemmatimonadetes bacterium]|nr:LemA family protein [Gemmatimonadota bacterium]
MKTMLVLTTALAVSSCGYNRIQTLDEQVNAFRSQIQVQLQRRADLVPNLVETVKGYAQHEETIFTS